MRYPCDKCEFLASSVSHRKQHIEIKHEGVRYPCDKCEYAATRVSDLRKHAKRKHSGVWSEELQMRVHCFNSKSSQATYYE